jgi:hypothetical protein
MGSDRDKHIEALYKALSYSGEQFDKSVLFIASGALGISFAFIDKLIPDLKNATSKDCLFNAWYCFVGVIFISLVSHFISTLSMRWSIKHYEEDGWSEGMSNWNRSIRILNFIMMIGLSAGALLLIYFIKQNI